MDEQNRRPDPQPESWLDTLPERPDSGPGQVPVPAEPPPSREIPEGQAPLPPVPTLGGWDDAGGLISKTPPWRCPLMESPPPYTVPPASPYGRYRGRLMAYLRPILPRRLQVSRLTISRAADTRRPEWDIRPRQQEPPWGFLPNGEEPPAWDFLETLPRFRRNRKRRRTRPGCVSWSRGGR